MLRVSLLLLLLMTTALPASAGSSVPTALAPRAGLLLVASERINDPRFAQSVILITRHDAHGTSGLILNHPLGKLPADLERTLRTLPNGIFWGGPVEPLHVTGLLLGNPLAPGEKLLDGLHLLTTEQLETMLHQQRLRAGELRVFIGYAGWAAAQLAREIEHGDWHVLPLEPDLLRELPAPELWPRLVPDNPSLWI